MRQNIKIKGTRLDCALKSLTNYLGPTKVRNPVNNEWAFRFVIQGVKENEEARFQEIDQLIAQVFNKNRFKHQKIPIQFGKGNIPLQSYEYQRLPYRVDFNRAIRGNVYRYEVIIYHVIN